MPEPHGCVLVPSIFMSHVEVPREAGEKTIITCRWRYDTEKSVESLQPLTTDWLSEITENNFLRYTSREVDNVHPVG